MLWNLCSEGSRENGPWCGWVGSAVMGVGLWCPGQTRLVCRSPGCAGYALHFVSVDSGEDGRVGRGEFFRGLITAVHGLHSRDSEMQNHWGTRKPKVLTGNSLLEQMNQWLLAFVFSLRHRKKSSFTKNFTEGQADNICNHKDRCESLASD